MKNKKRMIFLILVFCLIGVILIYKFNRDNKRQERYAEIRENVKKAVEWNLGAVYPFCTIEDEIDEKSVSRSSYHSDYLNQWGAIKMNELLDVDNESYCDAFVEIYQTPYDPKGYDNCEISYKIYLKCKNYEEEGYLK